MPGKDKSSLSFSRRAFLKGIGTTAVASATAGAESLAKEFEQYDNETVYGPGAIPMRFQINGESVSIEAAPNTTLLDVLRNRLTYTGAKEVCDRASCGACTVLVDGMPVNSCMQLAIEAQDHEITTVEGLAENGKLSSLQEAFIEEDGMMCGYCTSGFLISLTAFLKENSHPTESEVRKAVSGHLCRCGTYPRVYKSALRASGVEIPSTTEVIRLSDG